MDATARLALCCENEDGFRWVLQKPIAIAIGGVLGALGTNGHHLLYIVGAEGSQAPEADSIRTSAANLIASARATAPTGTILAADMLAQVADLCPIETTCKDCDGKGSIDCPACDGTGECACGNTCRKCFDGGTKCRECEGEGVEFDKPRKTLSVGLAKFDPKLVRNLLAGVDAERVTLAVANINGAALCLLGSGWVGIVMETRVSHEAVALKGVAS